MRIQISRGFSLLFLCLFLSNAMAAEKVTKPLAKHPDQDHPQNAPSDTDVSIIPAAHQKTFQLIVEAKTTDNLQQAILKTKQLMQQKGGVGETAAFLLGDLYLRQAHGGDQQGVEKALRAFGVAIRNFPKSENLSRVLLKRGDIYFDRQLYPEALGNYQRVSQSPDKKYAALAHLGMARSFQAWRRWTEALRIFAQASMLPFSPDQRRTMELIRADAIYQLGRFEEAYKAYAALLPKAPPWPKDPRSLFEYAESAYRTGRVESMRVEMKSLLREAYNADTQGPVAALALARLHTLLKMEGADAEATKASDVVYAMMPHLPISKTGKVMVAVGNLALCTDPCDPLFSKLNIQQLTKVSKSLLGDRPFTITAQGAVIDGLTQLERYKRYEEVEEIFTLLIPALPSSSLSPYTLSARRQFHQAVLAHFESHDDSKLHVKLYHRFRWAFEDQMKGETGLKIAKGYLKLKDYATALNLLGPIAEQGASPASEEALHRRGALFSKIGDYKAAERAFLAYRTRYPNRHEILYELGEVYDQQGKFQSAAVAYEAWLTLYPHEDKRNQVYKKLLNAYQRIKDLPNQIRIYETWIPEIPEESKRPYMALAEAYYQQGQYKDAISYYEQALTYEKNLKEIDWGLLHLANAYQESGQKKQAEVLLQRIQKKSRSHLMKQIAIEKGRDFKLPPVKGS